MARKVFFSFHYERDSWRAGQVRNCNLLPSEDQIGFIDAVDWESIKRQGDDAIKRWINKQLNGTSVTAVLIGTETADREWVRFELIESWNRGNGIVGVRIHNVKDQNKLTDAAGVNPFENFKLADGTPLSTVCRVYDWVLDDGRGNLGAWIDEAAEIRARFDADDEITVRGLDTVYAKAALAAGALLAGTAISKALTPRKPWCATE